MALVLVLESSLAITELCSWCLVSTQTSSLLGGFPALPVSCCLAHPTCPGPSQSPTCTELEFFSRSSRARLLTDSARPRPPGCLEWSVLPELSHEQEGSARIRAGSPASRGSFMAVASAHHHTSQHTSCARLTLVPRGADSCFRVCSREGGPRGLAQLSSWDGQGTGWRLRSQPAFLQAPRCRPYDTEGAQASFLLSVCEICKRVLNQSQLSLFL